MVASIQDVVVRNNVMNNQRMKARRRPHQAIGAQKEGGGDKLKVAKVSAP